MFAVQIQEAMQNIYNNEKIQLMREAWFMIFFTAEQPICMTVTKGTREVA